MSDFDLTPAEQRAYREDGFFVRRAQFTGRDLEDLRAAVERVVVRAHDVMRAEGDPRTQRTYWIDGNRYVDAARTTFQFEHRSGSETLRVVEPFHHLDPRLDALVDDPRLVHPMRGVIGTDGVSLWTEKINLKRPHEGSGFRWHQDSPYWVHACDHVDLLPNALVALDDADLSNGCFRVVRGSHRRGTLPGIQDETTLGPLFTDPDHFDESQQVPAEVPAGSIVFFSPHSVHGSQPNLSSSPRRAMVLTYQPADQPMFKLDGIRNAGGVRADAA